MLLQKPGQRAFELAGTVSVNQANDTLIGEQRFIEEPFGARQCLVDAAADHVEIGRARRARLKLDVDVDLRCRVRRRGDHAQVVDARAHPLAADVDVDAAVVNGGDDALQAEPADEHAITNTGWRVVGDRSAYIVRRPVPGWGWWRRNPL